ncbi:MAG: hypothetical protein ABF295_01860, partial [Flavobacteriaceae bacterium]
MLGNLKITPKRIYLSGFFCLFIFILSGILQITAQEAPGSLDEFGAPKTTSLQLPDKIFSKE